MLYLAGFVTGCIGLEHPNHKNTGGPWLNHLQIWSYTRLQLNEFKSWKIFANPANTDKLKDALGAEVIPDGSKSGHVGKPYFGSLGSIMIPDPAYEASNYSKQNHPKPLLPVAPHRSKSQKMVLPEGNPGGL